MQNIPTGTQPAARRTVTIHDLETSADTIVREVRETGEPIDVTDGSGVVARIEPAPELPRQQAVSPEAREEWLRRSEALAQEIGRKWPKGVSAQDAIDDVRGPR